MQMLDEVTRYDSEAPAISISPRAALLIGLIAGFFFALWLVAAVYAFTI